MVRRARWTLEWGGICPTVNVRVVELDAGTGSSSAKWEVAIEKVASGRRVGYIDESKSEGVDGMVGGG